MGENDFGNVVARYLAWVGTSAFRGANASRCWPVMGTNGMADVWVADTTSGECRWVEAALGRGEDAIWAALARIEKKLDGLATGSGTPPEYLSVKLAAVLCAVSQSHIRRAIYSGDLAASNVGTPARPAWRIARKDVVLWLEKKKGETNQIPPKSELRGLVDRYFG